MYSIETTVKKMENKWSKLIFWFGLFFGLTYALKRWIFEEFISDSQGATTLSQKTAPTTEVKTDVFHDIINKVSNPHQSDEPQLQLNQSGSWKNVINDINNHEVHMYRLQGEAQLNRMKQIDTVMNQLKKVYNDELCKRYVKFFKIDPYSVKMISYNTAEIKPIIVKNVGTYSSQKKQCVNDDDPMSSTELKCPEYIYCMNGQKSTNTSTILKDYEPVCHYTC